VSSQAKSSNELDIFRRAIIFFALISLAFSGSAYAGLSACTGTYDLGNSSASPTDLVAPGGASAGCEQVDKQFTAFNYTTGGTVPVSGNNVDVGFIGSSPTSGIEAQFGNPLSINPTWNLAASGATTNAIASYNIAVDPTAVSVPAGDYYSIVEMNLGVNYSLTLPATTSDSITVTEYFCGGGAAACSGGGASTGGINLADPTAGYIVFTVLGNASGGDSASESICFNNGGSSCTAVVASVVNFAATNYTSGFTDNFIASSLALTSGGTQVGLNYFNEAYFQDLETPEPSTFMLIGAALGGLALLRRRSGLPRSS
jgi:hypothetical protein